MSKTLTEQWREGTLPEDCYYILTKNGHIKKDRTCFYSHTDEQCFCFTSNNDIEEVLAPVPDYMDCKRLMNDSIELDKAKIKIYELVSKTEQLQKKLEIATKALKDVAYLYIYTDKDLSTVANNALKEMEGVK